PPQCVARVDGHADVADLAAGARVVGVHADLRRQIEGDRQAGGSALEEVAVAPVRLDRGGEAGVLAHRPELAAVHRGLRPARVRELARLAEVGGWIEVTRVEIGGVEEEFFVHTNNYNSAPLGVSGNLETMLPGDL